MQRRQVVSLSGLLALPMQLLATDRPLTPTDSEGPFYPVEPIPLRTNLLLDTKLLEAQSMQLSGRVVNQRGQPLADAKIEIWQCDRNGIYQHPAQNRHEQFDQNFAGYAAQLTDKNGGYNFTTLYPAPYPGRPPHIHAKIWYDNQQLLTTQLYPKDTASVSNPREALQITPAPDANGLLTAPFTFVV